VEAQRLRAMLAAELDRVRGSAAEIASIKQKHTASGRLLTTSACAHRGGYCGGRFHGRLHGGRVQYLSARQTVVFSASTNRHGGGLDPDLALGAAG